MSSLQKILDIQYVKMENEHSNLYPSTSLKRKYACTLGRKAIYELEQWMLTTATTAEVKENNQITLGNEPWEDALLYNEMKISNEKNKQWKGRLCLRTSKKVYTKSLILT